MDRNTVVGLLLIFGLFFAWQMVLAPSRAQMEAEKRAQDSIARQQFIADSLAQLPQNASTQPTTTSEVATEDTAATPAADSLQQLQLSVRYGAFAPAAAGTETDHVLENELMKVTFTSKGARIKEVLLKKHFKMVPDSARKDQKEPLYLLHDPKNRFEYLLPVAGLPTPTISTEDLYFEAQLKGETITFRAPAGNNRYFEQSYTLLPNSYKLDYNIRMQGLNDILTSNTAAISLNWVNYLEPLEKAIRYERNYSSIYFKPTNDRPDHCSCVKSDEEDASEIPVKWVSSAQQFFNASLLAETNFAGARLATEMLPDGATDLKKLSAEIAIPVSGKANESFAMHFYVGPNEFKRLQSMGHDLEDIIPFGSSVFGTINRWIIRPIFGWLADFISSKGIVILVLTFFVKLALFPLTYRMLYSQSKMGALKPELERLKERYKDDSQAIQMETMKMYREFGVNPLGSCLPMMLQMPIWFALYRFFPASIEFRQASFLWANDLSSYDEWIQLPFSIPLGFGDHLSLFTILWAITTLIYTYYNSRHMDFSANPAMKWMQYIMPVMFLGFFNSYASGLTAYLLFSNVINILQTIVTKQFIIDEEKIKSEMDQFRKKPKKKGGFQERLQKALEEQQRVAAERQKKK
ncbi:MAG: membrane protein insertase YidC [Lewinellaceae bacterium]|nr:membrane protein insertase YidC [Lewinellaceae bacterium]